MSKLQDDFLADLATLAPDGLTVRMQQPMFANAGSVFYQDADFNTILGFDYNFQAGYATIDLTKTIEQERQAVSANKSGSKPGSDAIIWYRWHVRYDSDDLAAIRSVIGQLLNARWSERSAGAAVPNRYPTDTCGCGHELVYTPEGWQHNVAPYFWGDDHDPQPDGGVETAETRRFDVLNCGVHQPDDSPEPGDRCKYCGVALTWIGPNPATDWAPVDGWENSL